MEGAFWGVPPSGSFSSVVSFELILTFVEVFVFVIAPFGGCTFGGRLLGGRLFGGRLRRAPP
jgi:hypothetical protein